LSSATRILAHSLPSLRIPALSFRAHVHAPHAYSAAAGDGLRYEISAYDEPLLVSAAFGVHVGIAKEILNHCPDAPYRKKDGWTYLHQAVWCDQLEFVEFILGSQQLRNKLVNMRNNKGKTALHYAVQKCNPIMVSALLSHKEVDFTMFDRDHKTAIWKLFDAGNHAKTLNWVSTHVLWKFISTRDFEATAYTT
jgi:ankyrin repeat protein